ncbi:MAG: hypothetical protein AAF488_00295 [Planctomycetota bacterium]
MPRRSTDVRSSVPALAAMALGFAVGYGVTGGSQIYHGLVGMWFGLAVFYAVRLGRWLAGDPQRGALWGQSVAGNALLCSGSTIFGAVMLWPRGSGTMAVWIVAGIGMCLTILGANAERRGSTRGVE